MPFRSNFQQTATMEWIIAGCIFGIILIAMTTALVVYRARPGRVANQNTEHTKIEGAYAFGLLLISIFIIVYTSRFNTQDLKQRPAQMTITVTGFQWCWRFSYNNPSATVSGTCQDGNYPTMVVPTGETIRFRITSQDVIHSFWMPHFRYKMDAFPFHVNTFEMSFPDKGRWLGHCVEFCGIDHADMSFNVQAVSPSAFRAWVRHVHASGPQVVGA